MILTIDNRVRISNAHLKQLDREVIDRLKLTSTHDNPDFANWQHHQKGYPPKPFVKSWRVERDGLSFPRGRWGEINDVLLMWDKVEFNWTSVKVPQRAWLGDAPWPFQTRLGDSALQKCQGIWRSKPASGKTNATLQFLARLGQKTLVVVPTDAVFTQWVERVEQNLGFRPGQIKGKIRNVAPDIVIGSQRTLWKCVNDIKHLFGCVVFDDAQFVGAASFQEVIDQMPAKHRLAVSGDEHRADGREFLIYDQFGTDVEVVSEEELQAVGAVVDVEVRVVCSSFRADWYVHLPDADKFDDSEARGRALADHRFTERHRLIDALSEDMDRNRLIVSLARHCLAEGQQVAVLCGRREHCLRLDAMISDFTTTSRLMGDDADFTSERERFASGLAKVAVGTYGKVGVGFESHRGLGRGVLASPVVSNDKGRMQFNQFCGRFARAAVGKKKAIVYLVHDPLVFGDKPITLLNRWNDRVLVQAGDTWETAASYLARSRRSKAHEKASRIERDAGDELFRSASTPTIRTEGFADAPKRPAGWGGRKRQT